MSDQGDRGSTEAAAERESSETGKAPEDPPVDPGESTEKGSESTEPTESNLEESVQEKSKEPGPLPSPPPPASAKTLSKMTTSNIIQQIDEKGNVRLFIRDDKGKIVGELKPMTPAKAKAQPSTPPVKKTPKTKKKTMVPFKTNVDRVRLAAKIRVAGVEIPPNPTDAQLELAMGMASIGKKTLLKKRVDRLKEVPPPPPTFCDVPNCKSQNYDHALSYFNLPVGITPERRRKWMHALGKPTLSSLADSGTTFDQLSICELHFEPDCFVVSMGKKMLKNTAVPTIAVARVTSLLSIPNKLQEVLVPPTDLGSDEMNTPFSAFLVGGNKSTSSPGLTAYEIPLIEQQIRFHRFQMEKLYRQAGIEKNDQTEVIVTSDSCIKDMKFKADIMARRKRIQELHKELSAKHKQLREEQKNVESVQPQSGSAAWTAATLLRAMRSSTEIPTSTLNRLKDEALNKAKDAKSSRDFYAKKTMAALKGEKFRPNDVVFSGNENVTQKIVAIEENEEFKKGCQPKTLFLQPTPGAQEMPPLILSGNPTESLRFLGDEMLQHFLRTQMKAYKSKLATTDLESGQNVVPRIGFVLSSVDESFKGLDLDDIVDIPEPINLIKDKDVLAEAVHETISIGAGEEAKGPGVTPIESNPVSQPNEPIPQPVPQPISQPVPQPVPQTIPQPILQESSTLIQPPPDSALAKDPKYAKFLNMKVVHSSTINAMSVNAQKEKIERNKLMAEINKAKQENDRLKAKLNSKKYEVEFLTTKVKKLEKSSVTMKAKVEKNTEVTKLKDEINELKSWKTRFLKKEKLRLKKTQRIIERRRVRRDFIMKEIEAGRMQQRDLYLIYSKSRLPFDKTIDDDEEREEGGADVGLDLDDETHAATAFISSQNGDTQRVQSTPNVSHHKTAKSPFGQQQRISNTPSRPKSVFVYKLKPDQKVHLPADHPQVNSIRNKSRLEIVRDPSPIIPSQGAENIPTQQYAPPQPRKTRTKRGKTIPEKIKVKTKTKSFGGKRRPMNYDEDDEDDESQDTEDDEYRPRAQKRPKFAHQEVPTQAGTVTLKYDTTYANAEFIQLPQTPVVTTTSAVYSSSNDNQMDYIIKAVDDLEQLKYSQANNAPTYYIQQTPSATGVVQLSHVQVAGQSGVQYVQQPRTSPRKHQRFIKYGGTYQ